MGSRLWGGIVRSGLSPALALDFSRNDMVVDHHIAVSGANGSRFNSDGVLATKACPRLDYDPATGLFLGWRFEAAATNAIPNNTMVGANVGTNHAPTGWGSGWTTPAQGITPTVVGTGVEDGIEYVDIRYQGTSTATGTLLTAAFNTSSAVSAAAAQVWTASAYTRLISGSLGTAAVSLRITEVDAGGVSGVQSTGPDYAPTTGSLKVQRIQWARTLTDATTARLLFYARIRATIGEVYDFTLRFGLPQLEQASVASSVIKTTTAAVSRSSDSATITVPGLTGAQGAFVFEASCKVSTSAYVTFSDGGASNVVVVDWFGTFPRLRVIVGGVTVASVTSTVVVAADTSAKIAPSWGADYAAIAVNGTATVSRAPNSSFPAATTLRLFRSGNGGAAYSGLLKSITAYTRSLIPSKLAELTV